MNTEHYELPVLTSDGEFTARYSEKGLVELNFPQPELKPPIKDKVSSVKVLPSHIRTWHCQTEAALHLVLAGGKAKKLPPLDWTGKTEFQQAVWRELLNISPGKTKSYGEIARQIGRTNAVRAVGGACGANPIPVLVPCHRVLAANRKLGGFSGGLEWKRMLLSREGVLL